MTESCEAAGSRSCLSYHSCPRSGKKTPPSTSVFLVSTPFPSSLPPVNQNVISSMSNHGKPFKNCDSICPQSPLAMCVRVCVWIIHVCSDLLEERISYWDWNSYFKKVLQTHTHTRTILPLCRPHAGPMINGWGCHKRRMSSKTQRERRVKKKCRWREKQKEKIREDGWVWRKDLWRIEVINGGRWPFWESTGRGGWSDEQPGSGYQKCSDSRANWLEFESQKSLWRHQGLRWL